MVPVAAEPIFHIGTFTITNSLINAWIAVAILVCVAYVIKRGLSADKPGKFQVAVEGLIEFLLGYVDQVTHDRERSKRFFPLVASLFLFILLSNWMSNIPGVGSIFRYISLHGEIEKAPIFRPANADLNLTLAMALVSVIASHLLGMITVGFFVHWNRFIALGTIWKGFRKGGMNIMVGLVEAMVGVIEFFSEIAKVVSLSLRLFGNIFAGEVLITVMYSLIAFIVPLPFMTLELIVGVVQATVFSMLTLVYLTILTEQPHGDEESHAQDVEGESHGLGHEHDTKAGRAKEEAVEAAGA